MKVTDFVEGVARVHRAKAELLRSTADRCPTRPGRPISGLRPIGMMRWRRNSRPRIGAGPIGIRCLSRRCRQT